MGKSLRHLQRHFVGYLALFVALGGTSFAAATLINGSQIKPHTISENRLTNSAIAALHGARGARGAPGAPGAQGPAGPQGAQGAAGAAGISGWQRTSNTTVAVPHDGSDVSAGAYCPAGKQAISGSYFTAGATGVKIRTESSSYAIQDVTANPGWIVTVANDGTVDGTLHVSVICANAS